MAQGGVIGNGTKVGFSSASPLSYTTIPQVLDVPALSGLVAAEIDTTVHNTVSNVLRNMPGMSTVAPLKVVILYDGDEATTAAYSTLFDLKNAGTTVYWRVEVPTTRAKSKWKPFIFQGWIKSYNVMPPLKDKQTLEIEIVFDDVSYPNLPAGASVL